VVRFDRAPELANGEILSYVTVSGPALMARWGRIR